MTTTVDMYDGINADAAAIARDFPGAKKVAGYVNGLYAWSQAEWNLFPHADHVTISVTASANAGDVLDVEGGDATPSQTAGWIAMRKAAGLYRPTIYCSRLVIPAVRVGTGSFVLGRDYDIWVADYTGVPHQVIAPGPGPEVPCAATQYMSTRSYDPSMVYDTGWPHRTGPSVIAAPENVSARAMEFLEVSWTSRPGQEYTVEVELANGTIISGDSVAASRTQTAAFPLGAVKYRVQVTGGEWTGWLTP